MKNYVFDPQLREDARPFSARAPKLSPEQQRKERHHVQKSLDAGHLKTPMPKELGPWTAPAHIVFKKDDPNGRFIVDFRMLNKSTIAMPISLTDVRDKVRRLAALAYKSMLDAAHGFNQIEANKESQQKLQIQASLGIKQYTVLPSESLTDRRSSKE